jgi:hypothetical protein
MDRNLSFVHPFVYYLSPLTILAVMVGVGVVVVLLDRWLQRRHPRAYGSTDEVL